VPDYDYFNSVRRFNLALRWFENRFRSSIYLSALVWGLPISDNFEMLCFVDEKRRRFNWQKEDYFIIDSADL
jgi:hypothetical protein